MSRDCFKCGIKRVPLVLIDIELNESSGYYLHYICEKCFLTKYYSFELSDSDYVDIKNAIQLFFRLNVKFNLLKRYFNS